MTVHFVTKGNHTENVIEVIKKRLNKGDIKTIIVATTKGDTALKMAEEINNCKIVAVTHQAGFVKPGEMEVEKDVLEKLKEKGVIVVTATHALAGIDRAVRKKHGTWELAELMAETLRLFGQGTKVAIEIVMMAADAGVINLDDVIAVGGTGRGADTAWVIKPNHSHLFFDIKVKELLCKPEEF